MAEIKVETTVQRQYNSESETVNVSGKEEKEITLSREVEDVEDMVWAIEAKKHKVVWDLWENVKDEDEFEGFGWHGYPKGDIFVYSTYDQSWHDVVDYIAKRDNVENPAGIYLDLRVHPRTPESDALDRLLRCFFEYLGEQGIDTNYYTHGKRADKDRRDYL